MWVGLAGEGAHMDCWLGMQEAGWVISLRSARKCHAAKRLPDDSVLPCIKFPTCKYEALPYGPPVVVANQMAVMQVDMLVDMTSHECSFKVSAHMKANVLVPGFWYCMGRKAKSNLSCFLNELL